MDIPKGFESLFGVPSGTPETPKKSMTTEQLIKTMKHNSKLIREKNEKAHP